MLGGIGIEWNGLLELLEFGFTAVEMGSYLLADKAADEAFEIGGRLVVSSAIIDILCFTNRTEGFQCTQALTCGTFGNAEFLHEVIKRERLGRDEKQAVNFTQRARHAEYTHPIYKKIHDLLLDRAEVLGFGLGVSGRQIHTSELREKIGLFKFF